MKNIIINSPFNNYRLYKKVFNNVIISKIIFQYVRFEYWLNENEKYYNGNNYEIYKTINKSFKTQDIIIEKLLSLGLYNLFNDYFQFYFKVAVKEPTKYWYYNLNLYDENEFKSLLSYKDLGFDRFLMVYENYQDVFKNFDNKVLNIAASSGNWSIFLYLQNEKLFKFQPLNYLSNFKEICNNFTNQELFSNYFSNGNDELIFKELYEHYSTHYSLDENQLFLRRLNEWLVETDQIDNLFYLIDRGQRVFDYKSLCLLSLTCENCENGLEIARKLEYNRLSFDELEMTIKELKGNVNFNVILYFMGPYLTDYQLLLRDLSIYGGTIESKKIKKIPRAIFPNKCLKLQNFYYLLDKWNDNEAHALNNCGFTPNFEEFTYMVKEKGKELMKYVNHSVYDRIAIKITQVSFDLEYFKFFLNYISIMQDYELPMECLNTKYEFLQLIINHYKLYSNYNLDNCKNLFFGDLKSLQLHVSLSPTNKSLDNLIQLSINSNYFEIVKYLIELKKPKLNSTTLLFQNSSQGFKIFNFINKYLKENKLKCTTSWEYFNGSNCNYHNFKEINIEIFKNEKYSFINYCLKELSIKPSSLLLTPNDNNEFINQTFQTRLHWFIEDDSNLILNNIDEIISLSNIFKNSLILNLILLSNQFNYNFKQLVFIKTIIESLSNVQDDDALNLIWLSKLQFNNLNINELSNVYLDSLFNDKQSNYFTFEKLNLIYMVTQNIIKPIYSSFKMNKNFINTLKVLLDYYKLKK